MSARDKDGRRIEVGDVVYAEGASAIEGEVMRFEDGGVVVRWREVVTFEQAEELVLERTFEQEKARVIERMDRAREERRKTT